MTLLSAEVHDLATAKKPPELRLAGRPACLGYRRRSGDGYQPSLEADSMISPNRSCATVGGYQTHRRHRRRS